MIDHMLSSDTHIIEPPDLWASRVPPEFEDVAPRVERVDGVDWWIVDGNRTLSFAGGAQTGARFENADQLRTGATFEDVRSGGYEPAAHLADGLTDGVFGSVLYPTEGLTLYRMSDSDALTVMCQAYNDWLAVFCEHDPERLKGVAMLNVDDVDVAVDELRRSAELGLAGGLIPTALAAGDRYDSPRFEPLWTAAEQLGMPLSLHLGANRGGVDEDFKEIRPTYFTVVDYWVKVSLADLIFSGVLDRHPGLRIGCIEHELGWIPHFLDRLDYTYTQRQGNQAFPRLVSVDSPSELFRRNVFVSFQDDDLGIRERHTIGINGLMWGSDYPHTESTFPRSRQIMTDRLGDIPADERSRITWGNAASIYGFSIDESQTAPEMER